MVFDNKNKSKEHHNRLNLRDTSSEPTNLFGDRNLPSSRGMRARAAAHAAAAQDDSDDINDRAAMPSDLPDLEQAHVPHAQRAERALRNKAQAKASEQQNSVG